MNIIVTCGPSYEPIDQVRRITNFSTGRLGITLTNALTDAGHRVFCLKGEQATDPTPIRAFQTNLFSTNDDLAGNMQQLGAQGIDAIFHAAALCDFKVGAVQNASGQAVTSAKFPTRSDPLTLTLVPTPKLLPQLRTWFPTAKIVGWKYELVGSRDDAIANAKRQIDESKTNACVLNGAAYGKGFLFITRTESKALKDIPALISHITTGLTPNEKQAEP